MAAFWHDFHLLRPWWLLALLPALVLTLALRRRHTGCGPWSRVVDAALLPYLLDEDRPAGRGWPLSFLLAAWIAATFGLAGPAWQKLPQPVGKSADALVLILDLSLSMYAEDLKPNRLTWAQRKLTDILRWRQEGSTALIVYSGQAHIVTPLTEDANTILAMVPALAPEIMPVYGSNVEEAMARALDLLAEAGPGSKDILLLTDEVDREEVGAVADLLAGREVRLSVIGIGTTAGAPVLLPNGEFLRDRAGAVVVPRLEDALLAEMAADNQGGYRDISLTDEDFRSLLTAGGGVISQPEKGRGERFTDQWQDQGFWLLFLVIPAALAAFRRGWLLVLLLLFLSAGEKAQAASWDDLWWTGEQQAARAFAGGDYAGAAARFVAPAWKGAAAYRSGSFAEAAVAFSADDTADGHYNRGNSLARLGRYDEAIAAYEEALARNPDHEDARFNRELVAGLRRQQDRQQQRQDERATAGEPSPSQTGGQEKGMQQDQGNASSSPQPQEQEAAAAAAAPSAGGAGQTEGGLHEAAASKQDGKIADTAEAAEQRERKGQPVIEDSADPGAEEEEQELVQLLRQVPENPGGLLRRKFAFEARQNGGPRVNDEKGKFW
ncbi:MAG: vWA domain-containing protein [Thermodesulfobacteriota bacterium]